jgi:hypothetical protein
MRRVLANILDGYASDGMGRFTDFSKCVFVLIASHPLATLLENSASEEESHQILQSCLGYQIASKIDRTIGFDQLTRQEMQAIVRIHVYDGRNRSGQNDDLSQRILGRIEEDSIVNGIIDEALRSGGNGNSLLVAYRRAIQTVTWQQMELQLRSEDELAKVPSSNNGKGDPL